MRIVGPGEIRAALDEDVALDAIRQAFVSFAAGEAQVAAVGHLGFEEPPGDCHIKSAHVAGAPVYVVKVSASFYHNPDRGLSSSQGLMLVFDAETGEGLGLLNDGGWLTDQRTALASVLAAQTVMRPGSRRLGVVGAGIQAQLQARMIARRLGFDEILLWGRNPNRAEEAAAAIGARVSNLESLCRTCDLIVTATPSTDPLVQDAWIQPGARILAVGADSPGKRELAPEILGRARVVVDSVEQCLHHGETSWAARAGLLDPAALMPLGRLLGEPESFASDEIVVVDTTGVAVQDAAIAAAVWNAVVAI